MLSRNLSSLVSVTSAIVFPSFLKLVTRSLSRNTLLQESPFLVFALACKLSSKVPSRILTSPVSELYQLLWIGSTTQVNQYLTLAGTTLSQVARTCTTSNRTQSITMF